MNIEMDIGYNIQIKNIISSTKVNYFLVRFFRRGAAVREEPDQPWEESLWEDDGVFRHEMRGKETGIVVRNWRITDTVMESDDVS